MSDELFDSITLAAIVIAVTLFAVAIILLIRRRKAGKSELPPESNKKNKKSAKQQKLPKKKEKGKKNKKQKKEVGTNQDFAPENNDTVPLIPTDVSDSTIHLYESDPRYPNDNEGATVLLSEMEQPEFKVEFEIGFAESPDVIE